MTEEIKGRVVGNVAGVYSVITDEGECINCRPRGVFRHEGMKLLPGDRVIIESDDNSNKVIAKILERKNSLIRPPLANLDILFCTASAAPPRVDILTFDKLITVAEHNGIEPVIVLTKLDVDREGNLALAEKYRKCGFKVFPLSSHTGEGVEEFTEFVKETKSMTSAFSGASGVGKSSLINKLFPALSLDVGDLSRKTARGKQTTRQSNLYPLKTLLGDENAEGYLADTPGFSMLDFVNFDFYTVNDLPELFREFKEHLGNCKYTKCRHLKEEGCAVLEAVKEGKIPESRHASFVQIYGDIKDKHPWDSPAMENQRGNVTKKQ